MPIELDDVLWTTERRMIARREAGAPQLARAQQFTRGHYMQISLVLVSGPP